MILPGYDDINEQYKSCFKCNRLYPLNEQYFRIDHNVLSMIKYRSVCKKCDNKTKKQVEKLKKQNSVIPKCCFLCGRETKLVLDHCHETGKFRSFLCTRCNRILGNARDDAKLLFDMSMYLASHNEEKYNETEITNIFDSGINKFLKEKPFADGSNRKGLFTLFSE